MIKKLVVALKYLSVSITIFLVVLSCEKDFKNIGVDLVDNDIFSALIETSEIVAYSVNVEKTQTNDLGTYLLGVQNDNVFGKIEASFVSQIALPETNPDYGKNAVIDSVIVDIPYTATLDGTQTSTDTQEKVPNFKLDSIWSSGNRKIQLNIFQLGTFLNTTDPEDPKETKKYFSNDTFIKTNPDNPLYSDVFSPNKNDTMFVLKRYKYPDYPDLSNRELYKTDTIKEKIPFPSIKIPFDNDVIKALFQDNVSSVDFASNANFQYYFRGLYFESTEYSASGFSMMNLDISKAKMIIYYSNDIQKDESTDQDLNGNGINGESDVWVRTPQSFIFPFSGVKANIFSRDIIGSSFDTYLNTVDNEVGGEVIFVQGASGAQTVLKLFDDDKLEELRTKNWLINDAKLTVYVDDNYTTNWLPQRLYLYSINEEENIQIRDAMPQSLQGIGGYLEKSSNTSPDKYIFYISDYITELLKPDSELKLKDFGIKVFDPNDTPNPQLGNRDTILKPYDSNPKGIALKGNLPISDNYRIKLEIFYSKKN
jgi:hypothetical protein